jgi:hypothetical protein
MKLFSNIIPIALVVAYLSLCVIWVWVSIIWLKKVRPLIVGVLVGEKTDQNYKKILLVKLDPEEELSVKGKWFIPAKFADIKRNPREVAEEVLVRYLEKVDPCIKKEASKIIVSELKGQAQKFWEELKNSEYISAKERGKEPSDIRLFEAELPESLTTILKNIQSQAIKFCSSADIQQIEQNNQKSEPELLLLIVPIVRQLLNEGTTADRIKNFIDGKKQRKN